MPFILILIVGAWDTSSVNQAILTWKLNSGSQAGNVIWISLLHATPWAIWKQRNSRIFNDKTDDKRGLETMLKLCSGSGQQVLICEAVIIDEKKAPEVNVSVPGASLQNFPPYTGNRGRGYQSLGSSNGGDAQQATNNWKGMFNISSYTQYFDVDTDVVVDRIWSSLYSIHGDFFRKTENNPDLYGIIWISTSLIFVIAALGNCATYLINKRSDSSIPWNFDVSYLNVAACAVYGYALLAPAAFYFLLQYIGISASLVSLWCMWGYSLFIFIPSSFLLVIPVGFLRWVIIIITGSASASFVALNMKSYNEKCDNMLLLLSAFILQMALAFFIKVRFFP